MTDSTFQQFLTIVRAKYPNYANAWESARDQFGATWEAELSKAIELLFGANPKKWDAAIDGYAQFCTDALRSQIFFERNGRYKASSYEEVARLCYHNADFMFRSYLPGMYLSHYVWPHHHRMLQFFRSQIRGLGISSFSEVGVGCGMYSKETLRLFPNANGTGYDISVHALEFTRDVVETFGYSDRYGIMVRDIVAHPPEPADLVICQEVLEHIESPAEFCQALHEMTRPGGYAYITGAINAGHVDHIYLYRTTEEVLDHVRQAGFQVVAQREEFAYGGKPVELTPCLGGGLVRRPA